MILYENLLCAAALLLIYIIVLLNVGIILVSFVAETICRYIKNKEIKP